MSGKDSVNIDDLRIDPQRRLVFRGQDLIRLPRLSYDLLMCLVRHSPAIVTTEDLLEEVWGDVVVGEETVKQRVSLLRQALDDRGEQPRYVESIRGIGYRLMPEVDEAVPAAAHRPVARIWLAALAVAMAAAAWLLSGPEPPGRAIAVLPFEDLSPARDQSYFSDGFHEELIARLSANPVLAVTSRTSVMPYRDSGQAVDDIASELGVDLVIEGSVRKAEGQVRVTIQLIDASQDRHLWAESYDRTLTVGNLFEIQANVADNVATALEARLGDSAAGTPALPTTSLEAYDRYLLGRFHLHRTSQHDLALAAEHFEAAIADDPQFAEAYVGLGRTLAFIGTEYGWLPPREAFGKAETLVEAALRLDPTLADGHSLRGEILAWYHWQWRESEAAYRQAQAYGQGTDLGYMLLLSVLGRHEEALLQAEDLLRRYPRDHWVRSNAAWRFLAAGDTDRTIEEASLAIEIDHRIGDPHTSRGWAYLAQGRIDEAIADFETSARLHERSAVTLAPLACAQIAAGNLAEGRALLAEVQAAASAAFVPPDTLAMIYTALGDYDKAFEWLQKALDVRSRGLIFLDVQNAWQPLRGDERFTDLREAVGLAEDR